MRPNLPCLGFNDNLLHESVHDILSLDPVLFFYAATFVAVLALWAAGVMLLGRKGKAPRQPLATAAHEAERVTPVAS